MKGIAWGELYNTHKDNDWDSAKLETEIARLMQDDDVTKKKAFMPMCRQAKKNT